MAKYLYILGTNVFGFVISFYLYKFYIRNGKFPKEIEHEFDTVTFLACIVFLVGIAIYGYKSIVTFKKI